jgi:hypothetical protein
VASLLSGRSGTGLVVGLRFLARRATRLVSLASASTRASIPQGLTFGIVVT